jgi:hypothetical protein
MLQKGGVDAELPIRVMPNFFPTSCSILLIAGCGMMYMGGQITALVGTPLAAASMPGSGAAL